jgi:TonB-linked SusC/RagA family outer membrane protein
VKPAFLLIQFLLATSVNIFSQTGILDRKVEIKITEGSIGLVLNEIGHRGGFAFSYGQDIPRENKIILNHSKQTVRQYLDEIFKDKIYCIEYGNKLIIMQRPMLHEGYVFRGRVVDAETKEPLPGVTIYIPGSKPLIGSVSDQEGSFKINMPPNQNMIRLSCIGYVSSSFVPDKNKPENFELSIDNLELNEVKIVSYKNSKGENINSPLSNISSAQLEKVPLSEVENALQGSSAGVHVVRNSGMPGASLQVKIRGINSLINSDPIYFLDGIYIQQSSLYAISPHDIESIEVLKDASGTAKYGASAGNGIVLLHSKKGNSKRLTASFNYYIGQQQLWKKPDLMTTTEFLQYYNIVRPEDSQFDKLDSIYHTDWMNAIFHKALTEDYHFSINRSNDRSNIYISSGYYEQSAIIKKLELKRYSFKVNSEHIINPGFRIGQDISLAYLQFKGLNEGCFLNDFKNPILGAMCMLPLRSSTDSSLIWASNSVAIINPHDDVELTDNSRKNYSLFTTLNSQVRILPKIRYSTILGFEVYYQDNVSYDRSTVKAAVTIPSVIYGNTYQITDLSYDWRHSILYSTSFSGGHSLNTMLDFEFGQNKNEWIPTMRYQYDKSMNIIADTTGSLNKSYKRSGSSTEFIHYAYSGSFQYAFKNDVHLNFDIRREIIGFYSDNVLKKISGTYPSFSLGWIFMRESPVTHKILDYGKIRYGWGKAGNSPRLNYSFCAKMMRDMEYISAFETKDVITNSAIRRQTNESFYLENMHSHNIGLDLELFKKNLIFSADYFYNHLNMGDKYFMDSPKGFIELINQMCSYGIDYLPVAEMNNTGFEWELNYKHSGHLMAWDLNLNFTYLKNKIINIEESELARIDTSNNYDPISVNLPGEVAGSFYGYIIDGLFTADDCNEIGYVIKQPFTIDNLGRKHLSQPNARAGDYKFADINHDGVIDKNDKTIIGNPLPKFTFGLFCNLQMLNFDFSLFFQGTYGNDIFNATKLWLYNPYGLSNWTRDIINSYREPADDKETGFMDEGNTNTTLHRFDYYNVNNNLRISDFYVEDGSYIRLKNIQLGYTINPGLTKKIHIQKFRIFVCAQNLLTITNYSGLDPEVGGWGIDCGIYPQPRTYLAGLNVTF